MNFIIKLVVYPFDIMVSIDESDKKLAKNLREFGVKKNLLGAIYMPKTGVGKTIMFEGNRTLIRLKSGDDKNIFISKIAHESFHAVSFIFQVIGIKLTNESEESFTYLLDYIILQILNKIK